MSTQAAKQRVLIVSQTPDSSSPTIREICTRYETEILPDGNTLTDALAGRPTDAILLFNIEATPVLFETLLTVAKVRPALPILYVGSPNDAAVISAQHGYTFTHLDPNLDADTLCSAIDNALRPRVAPRYELGLYTVRGKLTSNDSLFECPMLDISNTGLSFILPTWMDISRFLPGCALGQLSVALGPRCLLDPRNAEIRQIQPFMGAIGRGYRIGVEFVESSHPPPHTSRGTVRDPVRIVALVKDALQHRALWVSEAGESSSVQIEAAAPPGLNSDDLILHVPHSLNLRVGSAVQVSFEADGARYWFFTGVKEQRGDLGVVVRWPRTLKRLRQRRAGRYNLPDQPNITLDINSPFGAIMHQRKVLDISLQGLAFNIDTSTELAPVGMHFDPITLHFPNDTKIRIQAVVRSLSMRSDLGRGIAKCGVQFQAVSLEQQLLLMDAIVNGGSRETSGRITDATGLSFEDLWGFFRSIGFIYPDKEEKLAPVMDQVRKTFTALLEKPNRLSRTMVFKRGSAGEVVAHAAGIRTHSKTWMSHHLGAAKRRAGDPQVLRSILLGFAQYWDLFPDIEWLNMNFRPNNGWPQMAFGSFAARIEGPLSKLRIHGFLTAPTTPQCDEMPRIRVIQAEPRHLAQIEAHAIETLGPLEFQARDLSQHLIDLRQLNSEYNEIGLKRCREIWVAEDDKGVFGYALLDISSVGLNLSELLSTFRVHMIRPFEPATRALISKAKQRYHEHGRSNAIALVPVDEEAHYIEAGFTKKKEYAVWYAHRSLFRRYFEHVDRLTRGVSEPPQKKLSYA